MIKLILSDPCLLLNSKINEYASKVIDERNEFNYLTFDFETNPLEEIIETLNTPSFFGDKKVIVCKNPYFFLDSKTKLGFENDINLLLNYIDNENEDNLLIIICGSKYYNKKSKLFKDISSKISIDNLLFEDTASFESYAKMLVEKTNINITKEAFDILVYRCVDVTQLEREIAKLASYNKKIDEDVIEQMVARPFEDSIFKLSDALLAKDHNKIMQIYTDLKLSKVQPIQMINFLAKQFDLILQATILKNNYNDEDEIAKYLNVHPYRVKLALKAARKYPLNDVKNILVNLADLDEDIKTGKKDRYVDFEIFLATK